MAPALRILGTAGIAVVLVACTEGNPRFRGSSSGDGPQPHGDEGLPPAADAGSTRPGEGEGTAGDRGVDGGVDGSSESPTESGLPDDSTGTAQGDGDGADSDDAAGTASTSSVTDDGGTLDPDSGSADDCFFDGDSDGFGAEPTDCGSPEAALRGGDCNDQDPTIHPGASEGPHAHASCRDGEDNDCDGQVDDAELRCRPWTGIERVASLSSPVAADDDPSLTADRLHVVFASKRLAGREFIFHSQRNSLAEDWPPPQLLDGIYTGASMTAPELSADGLTLYYSVYTDGGAGSEVRISQRSRRDQAFPAGEVLWALDASDKAVYGCAPNVNNTHLVAYVVDYGIWYSQRPTAAHDWTALQPLPDLFPNADKRGPFLSAAADRLGFHRGGGEGAGDDIFVQWRSDVDSEFGEVRPVAELNTAFDEQDVWMSADETVIYFVSDRDGVHDIFRAQR